MSERVILEPAYVLHRYAYGNTSLIVELFTLHHGRVSAIARSARGPKSRYRGALQLFTPMLVSWVGRHELKTLGEVELHGRIFLEGEALLCSFYLNELLMRLLHRDDPYPNLFQYYEKTLQSLQKNLSLSATLRYFEKHLLDELGYGLPLLMEAESGEPISAEVRYQYIPERGFLRCDDLHDKNNSISGASIIALHHEKFNDEISIKETKYLIRMILASHLGSKPLKCRDLMK